MSTGPKDPRNRCTWCGTDPLYVAYHDKEWGVPVYDDRTFFEFLILEGAQAGLSWLTILRRREGYREAFEGFDPVRVAQFDQSRINQLLKNPGIIRNRLKVHAAVENAKAFLRLQDEFAGFTNYQWQWVHGAPIQGRRRSMKDLPARSELSDLLSKDLKQRGFRFVGSTILYAHLQATGLVNDHLTTCFRYKELT